MPSISYTFDPDPESIFFHQTSGTVLQHLLIAHEPEVLTLLLHYQTPFVLLRALNRPGCSEILQVLLGSDLRNKNLSENTPRICVFFSGHLVWMAIGVNFFSNLVEKEKSTFC